MQQKLFITLIVLLQLLACAFAYPTFEEYVSQFNKNYSDEEYSVRKDIYDSKIEFFESITTYTPGVNNFTDWTPEEIKGLSTLNNIPSEQRVAGPKPTVKVGNPTSLDWRDSDAVTSIKDQGSCGSCWSFAATAYAQSKLIIQGQYTKNNIDLSEQYLLECTESSDCYGGYMEYVMVSVKECPTEESYPYDPYTSYSGICYASGISTGYYHYDYYDLTDSELINLLQTGPVAISIASGDWTYYSSGVLSCSYSAQIDHAVLLVGYTEDQWIVKNQWGSSWGEEGYIRITRDSLYNCGIGASAHILQNWGSILTNSAVFLAILIFSMLLA